MADMNPDQWHSYLRRMFDAYTSPQASVLVNVLGDLQKARPDDWREFVTAVAEGVELHDGGQFPDEWFQGDAARP